MCIRDRLLGDSTGFSSGLFSNDANNIDINQAESISIPHLPLSSINNEITFRKIVIQVPKELGSPDGMAIDKNGNLWIAHYGGYGVFCWDPNKGKIIDRIQLPIPNVTSCCFGGKDLDQILFRHQLEVRKVVTEVTMEPIFRNQDRQ